ncbi:MAG TPA: hypothetical protein VIX87_07365, partial [Steroidobacteraceae bacterium]
MFARVHFRPLMIALAAGGLCAVASAGPDAQRAPDVTSAAMQHGAGATDPAHAGIWKAVSPPRGSMHGEFANNDPFGVSVGVKIEADCSLNWVDPDSGKLYCFSTATSLVYFLD